MERKTTRYIKHVTAMLLIMGMQSGDQEFPNIEFLKARNAGGNRNPPTGMDDDASKEYLTDMLGLLEFDLYGILLDWAATGTMGGKNLNDLASVIGGMGGIMQALGAELGTHPYMVPWDGAYPHPCYWIMREAVVALLA